MNDKIVAVTNDVVTAYYKNNEKVYETSNIDEALEWFIHDAGYELENIERWDLTEFPDNLYDLPPKEERYK